LPVRRQAGLITVALQWGRIEVNDLIVNVALETPLLHEEGMEINERGDEGLNVN